MISHKKKIIIIGAGVAGLSAGCYAQMSGFQTQIFEKHDKPGGLCTSWQRNGYTIDGCIHWLVGSSPSSAFYKFWEEIGAVQEKEFVYFDEYLNYETEDGKNLSFSTNLDILRENMINFATEDKDQIDSFINFSKKLIDFQQPLEKPLELYTLNDGLKLISKIAPFLNLMRSLSKISISDFASRFKNQHLKNLFLRLWFPEFSLFFLSLTLTWLHKKEAGYPIGGSFSFAKGIEKRYLELGGKINYNSPVKKILIKDDKAIGVELENGTKHYSDIVISASDLYKTIFKLLEGKYVDEKIKKLFDMPIFPPLLYISLGVNRTFKDLPYSIEGFDIPLKKSIKIDNKYENRMRVRIHNFDPTLSPQGKTLITIAFNSNYDYWRKLYDIKDEYKKEKNRIFEEILYNLDYKFPKITNDIEIWDIATPITFERYTENYKGSFEGWLLTPKNFNVIIPRKFMKLKNFYISGHWTLLGGGLPSALISSRWTIQLICHDNKIKFMEVAK